MKFDVDDKNRCRLVCVKCHLNRCRFAVAVAKCLGGSLFWDTVYSMSMAGRATVVMTSRTSCAGRARRRCCYYRLRSDQNENAASFSSNQRRDSTSDIFMNCKQKLNWKYWFQISDTHTRLAALCLGLPRWAGTRKVKPIWILLKQETASGSGISWAICKSAPCSRQITTPAPHHSSFLQAGFPSCLPTNSVKALKAKLITWFQISDSWTQNWT